MNLQDELLTFAGLTDRLAVTFSMTLLPLIGVAPAFTRAFLEQRVKEEAGATIQPAILRMLEQQLTIEMHTSIEGIEENAAVLLAGAGQMSREHVLAGLEEEEFDDPIVETQKDSGISAIKLAFAGVAGVTFYRALAQRPFKGSAGGVASWPQWFARTAAEGAEQTLISLRAAVREGTATSVVIDELKRIQANVAQSAFTTSRGAVTSIVNQSLLAAFAKSGVVSSVRYVAILDDATSHICQGLSGSVWPLGSSDIKSPPRHPNCRSILMPILKGRENEPPPPSYEDWLKKRPVAEQKNILGPSRFSAFRAGLSLSQMATPDSAISLDELQRLHPAFVKGVPQ